MEHKFFLSLAVLWVFKKMCNYDKKIHIIDDLNCLNNNDYINCKLLYYRYDQIFHSRPNGYCILNY